MHVLSCSQHFMACPDSFKIFGAPVFPYLDPRLLCNHCEQSLSRLYDHQTTIWQPSCALSWRCFRSCSFWLCKASTSCALSNMHKSFHYFSLVFESQCEVSDSKGKATNCIYSIYIFTLHFKMCQMRCMLEIAQSSTSNILHLTLFPRLIKFQGWATQKRRQKVKLRSLLFP